MSANKIRTIICAALALSGCSNYLERTDKIHFNAGDAKATNVAIQTIDPWSPASRDRRTIMNGDRAQLASERYRTNTSIAPQGTGTSSAEFEDASSSSTPQ